MSTIINKSAFKKSLESKQSEITTKKELAFFESFFFLNENQGLPPDLKGNRNAGIDKLKKDHGLTEKYYLFHLIKTIDTKWQTIKAEDIVSHFYKNCKLIKEIWEEL